MATTQFHTSRLRPALGTFVAIEATGNTPEIIELSISAGFDAIVLVERLMHPTRDGSELAALRHAPVGTALTVHAWTFAVLELCRQFHRLSDGAFDPCLPTARGRLSDLELCAPDEVKAHAPLHLDLGGIAKGFAVDRALDALRKGGCSSGLVNAGGDLATFGTGHNVVCRRADGRSRIVQLRDAALATSDTAQDAPPPEHQGYYHGREIEVRLSGYAAVMAPNAATADALTKCLLAGGNAIAGARLLSVCGARRIEFSDEE